jgi:hypothetical protein
MKNFAFLVVLLTVAINAPALAGHKNLTIADLKKAAYEVAYPSAPELRDIYHLEVPNVHCDPPYIMSLHEYAFGDLNGDGLGDAVAFVGLNGGGTAQDMSLVALINDHGKAKSVDYITLGDRTGCTSLKIAHGAIIFDALIHKYPHGACWGEVPKRLIYRLAKNKLLGPRHVDDDR